MPNKVYPASEESKSEKFNITKTPEEIARDRRRRAINSMLLDLWGNDNDLYANPEMLIREEDGSALKDHGGARIEGPGAGLKRKYEPARNKADSIYNFFNFEKGEEIDGSDKKLQILVPGKDGSVPTIHNLSYNSANQTYEISEAVAVKAPEPLPKPGLFTRFLSFFGVHSARQQVDNYNNRQTEIQKYNDFCNGPVNYLKEKENEKAAEQKKIDDAQKQRKAEADQKARESEVKLKEEEAKRKAEAEQQKQREEQQKAAEEKKQAEEKAAFNKLPALDKIQRTAAANPNDAFINRVAEAVANASEEETNRAAAAGYEAINAMQNLRTRGASELGSVDPLGLKTNIAKVIAFDMMATQNNFVPMKTLANGIFLSNSFKNMVKSMDLHTLGKLTSGDGSTLSDHYHAISQDAQATNQKASGILEASKEQAKVKAAPVKKEPSIGAMHN